MKHSWFWQLLVVCVLTADEIFFDIHFVQKEEKKKEGLCASAQHHSIVRP